MPPITRRSARINAFPDVPNDSNDDAHHEQRPLLSEGSTESKRMNGSRSSKLSLETKGADTPPIYTIDLSLPPAERYVEVANNFKSNLVDLIHLFNEVAESLNLSISLATVKWLAKLFLRRVYSSEQTEELRGISNAIGVEMYLLVAFNTLLDLFMGCTSGGVRVSDGDRKKMLHFRTLDWGMDVLRKVVVQFEFVERPHGEIVARSVGYVGFVGILTGVRPDLSLSLNFRGHHDNSDSKWANIKYYGNHLAVLLGFRPSIASRLREYLLPRSGKTLPNLAEIASELPSTVTTACYIIACNGDQTTIFEKDLTTAHTRSATDFITATNHDHGCENDPSHPYHPSNLKTQNSTGMEELIAESIDRKECIETKWRETVTRRLLQYPQLKTEEACARVDEVQWWMTSYPTANECTHYAVIMDPKEGEIVWCRRWKKPLKGPKGAKFDRRELLQD